MTGPNAFPPGGIRELLRTSRVTEPTRAALRARLNRSYDAPLAFDAEAFATLKGAVVDPEGESFDVPGLFIADNSTFPSALGANPSLTIMALSLRTADRFLNRARRGET